MASTFSGLKFELIGSGEQSNTWGNTTNTNIGTAIEQAITGLSNPVFLTDTNLTISLSDLLGPALQVPRALVLNVTSVGNLTVTRELIVPTIEKQYLVQNNTSGGQSITVKTSAGTGITVPNGKKMHLYVDGVNVIDAVTHFSALTLGAALPIASGGTGATSATLTAGTNVTITGTWPNQTVNAAFPNLTGAVTSVGTNTSLGSFTSANLAGALTDETGSGSAVFATSPTLVTPDLGTPSALVGTNITGTAAGLTAGTVTTNANLTGMVTSVGNNASLGSFTSANLAAALTDETGSGAAVFATSPTLVTPNLGTPSALVGTNITGTAAGLTAGTVTTNANLTGMITSVGNNASLGSFTSANLSAALTDETGSGAAVFATSPTLISPALGTPSALVGTNITGTAAGLTAGTVTTNANLTGMVTSVGNNASLGSFTSANLAAALTDETGTGAAVFATSPTLVTPNLGTPSTLVGTNITGTAAGLTAGTVTTNANLTGMVTSVGNNASLGSFTSANLAGALTDETGSGAAVFATSPTLVTPVLGTPTSGALTNCTADGTNKVGYRNVPASGTKTSSYTLVAADVGKFVELGTGGTIVVPAAVFAAGDVISIFNNTSGTIACTCSAVTDFYKAGTDADISAFSITTRGVANILFITATRAVVTGNLA